MRFISTRVHGVLDYLMGALLIASPWLLNFDNGGAETWVPVILGITMILQALMTNYELGAFKSMSMATHLRLDFFAGLFLAASPWIFGFSDYVWQPHLILGLMEVAASLTTRRVPDFVHSRNVVNNPLNNTSDRF
ncbi:SPW repeat protein [Adhaeribacter aquaticus]|uniref:SPW repeat protein n=1 Tax=Adhaeribacter aquaticus TaxID=299567 RepID=UPI00047ADB03|nr:SPW repeat protein [Adhaeribacter aquaticus]